MLRFKHLLPKERLLWRRFLEYHEKDYLKFEYDVRLGIGITDLKHIEPKLWNMVKALSKKRVDAIGIKERQIDLIEVKVRGGLSAVGQLLAYLYFYKAEYKPVIPVHLILLTDFLDEDTRKVCRIYGIRVIQIRIDWNKYKFDEITREYIPKEETSQTAKV